MCILLLARKKKSGDYNSLKSGLKVFSNLQGCCGSGEPSLKDTTF